jgi:hypothetical protein
VRGRRIEPAFDLIAAQAKQWSADGAPTTVEQAELHRRIAALYRPDARSWRDLLGGPSELGGDIRSKLRNGAESVVSLLPVRLKASPKWAAAGAAAGALGCVAAATLLSPAAIAALPMWSGIGAGIAAVTAMYRKERGGDEDHDETSLDESSPPDLTNAVRAAALFALLLELQGRGETTITRVLDRSIPDDDMIPSNGADARAWLDDVRHRFDLALAQEAAP